jgi:hypothetical protein
VGLHTNYFHSSSLTPIPAHSLMDTFSDGVNYDRYRRTLTEGLYRKIAQAGN